MFSSRLSLSALIELCRSLRHYLGAGLSLVDVFRQQARRGPAGMPPIAASIAADLEQGHDLEHALKPHRASFPPLFLSLASVGEESGNLPEIFGELEKYFRLQQRLRRQFWSRISWPLFQFFAGIFVIAGMLLVLGMFGSNFDPLGLGLTGKSGALWFLAIVFGTLGLLAGVYLLIRRLLTAGTVDAFLLRLPAIGPCLEALALNRFCLALRLTMETGMSIIKAVRLSMRGTGNEAFIAQIDPIVAALRGGEDLTESLSHSGLFPEDFQNILANAEEGGRVTEVLAHQADHYEEEASRRLSLLTSLAGYGIWLLVGLLLILAIFRIALTYINLLNQPI